MKAKKIKDLPWCNRDCQSHFDQAETRLALYLHFQSLGI